MSLISIFGRSLWPHMTKPTTTRTTISLPFTDLSSILCGYVADMLQSSHTNLKYKANRGIFGRHQPLKRCSFQGNRTIWTALVEMLVFSSLTTSILLLSVVVPTLGELTWSRTKFLFTFGDSYTTTGILFSDFIWHYLIVQPFLGFNISAGVDSPVPGFVSQAIKARTFV